MTLNNIFVGANVYKDFRLYKTNRVVPYIFTSEVGIYAFLTDERDSVELLDVLKGNESYFFFFIIDNNGVPTHLYDFTQNKKIELDVPFEQIKFFYENHMIPVVDLPHYQFNTLEDYLFEQLPEMLECPSGGYVKPLLSMSELERIEGRIEQLISSNVIEKGIRISEDGLLEVEKEVTRKIGPFDTMYSSGKQWYRCSNRDADKFYLLTFLGGLIGVHKYADKKILEGILYTLTFGLCGVMYVSDLFTMLLGNYYSSDVVFSQNTNGRIEKHSDLVFLQPLKKKGRAVIMLICSIMIAFFAVNVIYQPLITFFSDVLSNIFINIFVK